MCIINRKFIIAIYNIINIFNQKYCKKIKLNIYYKKIRRKRNQRFRHPEE